MTSKFVSAFKTKSQIKYQTEEEVVSFSSQIQDILKVSDEMLESMAQHDYDMDIGSVRVIGSADSIGIKLRVKNRCFTDGWAYVLEAVPSKSLRDNVCLLRKHWKTNGGGTATAIVPNDGMQHQILNLVKDLID